MNQAQATLNAESRARGNPSAGRQACCQAVPPVPWQDHFKGEGRMAKENRASSRRLLLFQQALRKSRTKFQLEPTTRTKETNMNEQMTINQHWHPTENRLKDAGLQGVLSQF
jgi:hypothetical protein